MVPFLTGSGDFYFLQSNQTGYEAHKALYSEGTDSTFLRSKADGA